MKFNKHGYLFRFHGDEILRYWPWATESAETAAATEERKKRVGSYRSSIYERDFNSFSEYWMMVGEERALIKAATTGKVIGFNNSEVIGKWSSQIWVNEIVVILTDINFAGKERTFWNTLTAHQRTQFIKDVVVLKCRDKNEASELVTSISPDFATATTYLNGKVLFNNLIRENVE